MCRQPRLAPDDVVEERDLEAFTSCLVGDCPPGGGAAGSRTAVLSALVIGCLGVPLMLSLLVLQRIAGRTRPAEPTARRLRSVEGRP